MRQQNSATSEMSVFAFTNRFRDSAPQMYGNQLVSLQMATNDQRVIVARAVAAARELYRRGYGYKKAGVVATGIIPSNGVMQPLFDNPTTNEREHRLSAAVDAINRAYGRGKLRLAVQGSGQIRSESEKQSPHYTTLWSDIPSVTVK